MMDGKALRKVIVETSNAIQKLLVKVVAKHAVEHKDTTSNDANKAFSEVLKMFKDEMRYAKSWKNTENQKDMYDSTSKAKTIKASIVIERLDGCLLLDFLLEMKSFLNYRPIDGICLNRHTSCCKCCNHKAPDCNKCKKTTTEPSKCDHFCQSCRKSKLHCSKIGKICCIRCKMCLLCNEAALECKIVDILNGVSGLRSRNDPCKRMEYTNCFIIFSKIRNLSAHPSEGRFDSFLQGKEPLGNDLNRVQSYQEFERLVIYAFTVVLGFITNPNNFKSWNLIHYDDEMKKRKLCNIECILEHGIDKNTYDKNYQRKLESCLQMKIKDQNIRLLRDKLDIQIKDIQEPKP